MPAIAVDELFKLVSSPDALYGMRGRDDLNECHPGRHDGGPWIRAPHLHVCHDVERRLVFTRHGRESDIEPMPVHAAPTIAGEQSDNEQPVPLVD